MLVTVFASMSAALSEGIVVIDVPTLQPRFVPIKGASVMGGGFTWARDSKSVVVCWGQNGKSSIRQYDLKGAVKRTWHVRGRPAHQGQGTFTPSGRRFVTACTGLEQAACVWDTATGKAVTRVKLAFNPVWGTVLGWYDENHLLAPTRHGVGIVDLKGRVTKTLIKIGGKDGIYLIYDN